MAGSIAETGAVSPPRTGGSYALGLGFWSNHGRVVAGEDSEIISWSDGLSVNHPNPFRRATSIGYSLASASPVHLSIYDIGGGRVTTLVDQLKPAGTHLVHWDGRDGTGKTVPSGVYFYRLQIDSRSWTRKMLKLQ